MSTQRNKLYLRVLGTVIFTAGYLVSPLNTIAEAKLTKVEVSFGLEIDDPNFIPLQILKTLEGPMLNDLKQKVRADLISRCQDRFPYLDWIEAPESSALPLTSVRLEVRMKRQNPSDKLFLDSTLVVKRNEHYAGTAIVYDTEETHPDPCHLGPQKYKMKVLDKTKRALVSLIPDASILGSKIPLTHVLYPEPNDQRLILPVLADDFNAGSESKLKVRFISTWPAGRKNPARIDCEIFDKIVDDTHNHFGMQTCKVKLFSYPGYPDVEGWCNKIPLTLENQVQNSLEVFMKAHIDERIATGSGVVNTP